MSIRLDKNAYGKNAIQLSKIIRHPDRHEIRQITVAISLQGDFEAAHVAGDNSLVLPTDTMKNTVYALAKDRFTGSIEEFGIVLAAHFLSGNPQVSVAGIDIYEEEWQRMSFSGIEHPHAFIHGSGAKHTTGIVNDRQTVVLSSGIRDLLLLKTTDSGFEGYVRDRYTTLKETADRILSTSCEAIWTYESAPPDPGAKYEEIRQNLLHTFSGHKSHSVQHTLYAMGEQVLNSFPEVREITLKMPNKHHILFDLGPFGMENKNEVFIATAEPYGYITGTVSRCAAAG